MYALRAADGSVHWKHAYPGRPDEPLDRTKDGTRIFSSPVVVDGKVIIGTDVDGDRGRRGYVLAASLKTGKPVWVRETDVDDKAHVLNDGCGDVWSSGTLLPKAGLVVFDVADCHFAYPPPLSETVIALRVRDGGIAWTYRPERNDTHCDFDFGATANAGLSHDGTANFLGLGGKEGTYYSLDPATGKQRWNTNLVFGGFSGGFIAIAAYDGRRVYGSTAIGDFGRFAGESGASILCNPSDPRDPRGGAARRAPGSTRRNGRARQRASAGGAVLVRSRDGRERDRLRYRRFPARLSRWRPRLYARRHPTRRAVLRREQISPAHVLVVPFYCSGEYGTPLAWSQGTHQSESGSAAAAAAAAAV